jgi:hypothetical protein
MFFEFSKSVVYNGMDWDCPTYTQKLGEQLAKYHGSIDEVVTIGNILPSVQVNREREREREKIKEENQTKIETNTHAHTRDAHTHFDDSLLITSKV